MVRPCESTRTLPRLVLATPIVGAFPSGAFGEAVPAVAWLLLLPPHAATDNAASGTASAMARRLMGVRRLIGAPSRGCYCLRASCLPSPLSSATGRIFGLRLEGDSDRARTRYARWFHRVARTVDPGPRTGAEDTG